MNFEVQGLSARPGPERALLLSCRYRWNERDAFLLSLDGRLSYKGRVLSEHAYVEKTHWGDSRALLRQNADYYCSLVVPISSEAIRFIEQNRGDADVQLTLELRCKWQEPQMESSGSVVGGGAIYWQSMPTNFQAIPRSEWLKRLNEMEWDEIELFEIAKLPLLEEPSLTEALRLLAEAQTALRNCDYKGVLAKCSEAFESAAKYQAQGDTKQGFESLFSQVLSEFEEKQRVMNSLTERFREYTHFGRHARYPALHISRDEAEFVLTTSLGLFSLISRRMGKHRS